MIVGISVWEQRVSPLLDSATQLLVVRLRDAAPAQLRSVELPLGSLPAKARCVRSHGVQVLVCGAVSRSLGALLAAGGVRVVGWVAGDVEEVLHALVTGRLTEPRFAMPGCGAGHAAQKHAAIFAVARRDEAGPPCRRRRRRGRAAGDAKDTKGHGGC